MTDELTRLEKQVVALALRDPLSSLTPQRRLSAWLFGGQMLSLPLANPRLEALRRYVVLSRSFGAIPPAGECDRLADMGFERAKRDAIDALLAPYRTPKGLRAHVGHFFRRIARSRASALSPPSQGPTPGTAHHSLTNSQAKENMAYLTSPRSRLGIWAALLPIAATPTAVCAQAEPATQGPPDGYDDGDHIVIGVGGVYAPAYQGADDYRFQPLPMIDVKWGRFFANFQDGIGANLIETEAVTVGVGLTMADGYRRKDAPPGIGKLSAGLGGRGFVKLRQAGFEATLGATKIITGNTEGVVADASLAYPIIVSEKLMLMPSIGTRWANAKHNNRYFGVAAQQSAASGLAQYRAGSGLVDAKAELGIVYRLTDRIGVMAIGGLSSLLGDAKDSPIVYHKTRPHGIFAITYSF